MTDADEFVATARAFGLEVSQQVMPNGETRFRLIDSDGSGYIRTIASRTGAWQSSHFHKDFTETYFVQRGWICVAQLDPSGAMSLSVLETGEMWTALPFVPHKVYMSSGAVTHTVKHGAGSRTDWETSSDTVKLDVMTRALGEDEIRSLHKKHEDR